MNKSGRQRWRSFAPSTGKGGGYRGPPMLDLMRHKPLLSCIQSLIGNDIIGSSVYRIRPKVPGYPHGEVPWHQDSGFSLAHCDPHLIVTCWLPLCDATEENGCLWLIPGVHGVGIARHHTDGHEGFLEITRAGLPRGTPIPVPTLEGAILLMTNMTPHASFENGTDRVRWSVDVRYQDATVPNNVGEQPDIVSSERTPATMACYPPEADFGVRSSTDPDSEIRTAERFDEIRRRFEDARPDSPGRAWRSLATRPSA